MPSEPRNVEEKINHLAMAMQQLKPAAGRKAANAPNGGALQLVNIPSIMTANANKNSPLPPQPSN
jgi:hypothetical protein